MKPKEFAERMRDINEIEFTDDRHHAADELMCEVLNDLGYEEGVEIFENMNKWYA